MRAVVVLELDLPDEIGAFEPVRRALSDAEIPHLARRHMYVGTGEYADRVLAVFAPTESDAEGGNEVSDQCKRWPGWRCTRPVGHDGPCPLWPRWWNIPARFRHWRAGR